MAVNQPTEDKRIQSIKDAIVAKIKPFIKDFKEENLPLSFRNELTELLRTHPVESVPASSSDIAKPIEKKDLNKVFATLDGLMSAGFVMRAKGDHQFDLSSIATDTNILIPILKPSPSPSTELILPAAETESESAEKLVEYKLQQSFIKLINKIPASQNEAAQAAREKLILVALTLSDKNSADVMLMLGKIKDETFPGYSYLVAQLYKAMYPGATETQIIEKVGKAKEEISKLGENTTLQLQATLSYFQSELAETKKAHQTWMQNRQQELYWIPGLIMDVGDLQTLYQQAQNDFAGQCYKAMALGKTPAATATAAAATSFEKDLLQLNEEEKKHVETVEYSGGMLGKSTVQHCVKEFKETGTGNAKYPAGSSILKTNGEPMTINMVRIWLSTFAAGYRVLDVSRINNAEPVNIAIPSDNGVEPNSMVTVTAQKLVEIVAQTPPLNHIIIGGGKLPETGFANDNDLKALRAYVTKEMNVPLKMIMDSSNKPAPPSPPPLPVSSSSASSSASSSSASSLHGQLLPLTSTSTPAEIIELQLLPPSSHTTRLIQPPKSLTPQSSSDRVGHYTKSIIPNSTDEIIPKSREEILRQGRVPQAAVNSPKGSDVSEGNRRITDANL
ncbi:MAG: hypothetical protein A2X78_04640 [Gammaproteobacteria bacterium GWE2_37_16]|nr:MAG: hypothetical protein A2X78_04640 [Gammaproteobacteria bacterium GWE2_37_16]